MTPSDFDNVPKLKNVDFTDNDIQAALRHISIIICKSSRIPQITSRILIMLYTSVYWFLTKLYVNIVNSGKNTRLVNIYHSP